LNWKVESSFYPGGRFQRQNSVYNEADGTDRPWLFASRGHGLRTLTLPLLEASDGKARYRVRLGFLESEHAEAGQRVFEIRLQGETVAADFDIAREAGGARRVVWKEFGGVEAEEALTLEMIAAGNPSRPASPPLLCALEVVREAFVAPGCAVPDFEVNDRDPKQTGTICLSNLDEQAFRGRLVFEPPAAMGWEPRELPVELATGERRALSVAVSVGSRTKAGQYEIPVRLLRDDGSTVLERTIHVEHLGPRARMTIKVAEDAHVIQRYTDRNFGTVGVLLVDGGSGAMKDAHHGVSLFKFPTDVPGRVVSAKFRIVNAGNPTRDAGRLCLVEGPWSEKEVTYRTLPKLGRELAQLGRLSENQIVECDIPVELLEGEELSLAIDPTSTDGVDFLSRESGSGAELLVEYE
jgi:hypothetical protein